MPSTRSLRGRWWTAKGRLGAGDEVIFIAADDLRPTSQLLQGTDVGPGFRGVVGGTRRARPGLPPIRGAAISVRAHPGARTGPKRRGSLEPKERNFLSHHARGLRHPEMRKRASGLAQQQVHHHVGLEPGRGPGRDKQRLVHSAGQGAGRAYRLRRSASHDERCESGRRVDSVPAQDRHRHDERHSLGHPDR